MTILILVITITWSFGMPMGGPVKIIVSSPEEAALHVYNDRPPRFVIEPDRKEYVLYQVDLKKESVKTVPIPEVVFQQPKDTE